MVLSVINSFLDALTRLFAYWSSICALDNIRGWAFIRATLVVSLSNLSRKYCASSSSSSRPVLKRSWTASMPSLGRAVYSWKWAMSIKSKLAVSFITHQKSIDVWIVARFLCHNFPSLKRIVSSWIMVAMSRWKRQRRVKGVYAMNKEKERKKERKRQQHQHTPTHIQPNTASGF